ncbi:MAG TPA: helix-turn-helix domain-containing protein [Candidatus Binatia bacterium]|nr:helix-turn-helix domain-containing protein [Candidatus Binatia bacterium]
MGKPYSQDLRGAVVQAIGDGSTREEVAEAYELSPSSVDRFLRRWRASGNVSRKSSAGKRDEPPDCSLAVVALLYERRSGFLLALDCRQGGASLAPLGSNLDRGVHARPGRAMGRPRWIQAASPAVAQGTLKARMYSSAAAELSS